MLNLIHNFMVSPGNPITTFQKYQSHSHNKLYFSPQTSYNRIFPIMKQHFLSLPP